MKKALLILHQKRSHPGDIGNKLEERGYLLDIRKPCIGDKLPNNLNEHSLVVIFGGPMSVNDPNLDFDYLSHITGADYLNEDREPRFEVIYELHSIVNCALLKHLMQTMRIQPSIGFCIPSDMHSLSINPREHFFITLR